MESTNAKSKAPAARGNEESCQREFDPDEHRGTRLTGSTLGHQPIGIDRAGWEGANYCSQSGGIPSGGILDQLIESTRSQLAQLEVQRGKTTEYLIQLEALREQLHKEQLHQDV